MVKDVEMINYIAYRSLKGCLCCLSHMMPNFFFIVGLRNQFKENTTSGHFKVATEIFRHLKGTLNFGLWYKKHESFWFVDDLDGDDVGDHLDRKMHYMISFLLGYNFDRLDIEKTRVYFSIVHLVRRIGYMSRLNNCKRGG